MRTIAQIDGIAKETDLTKFPDSGILNETETSQGTPVIREIYNDMLVNFYKLLRLTKVTANNLEDNELNGYQIINALKLLANNLNDKEQQLNLIGTVFSINIDLSILPDKYFFFAKAVEGNTSGTGYTFKGSGNDVVYGFTAINDFASGDELLLILDQAGVRAYNLSASQEQSPEVFTPFGTPIAFNNGSKVYYGSDGNLFSDLPEAHDLQSVIRVLDSDGTIIIQEMVIVNGYVICLGFFPNTLTYKFYKLALANLSTAVHVTMTGGAFPVGTDNRPHIYTDGTHVYITNATGTSVNDYSIDIYLLDTIASSLTKTGNIGIDNTFEKTTNVVVQNNKLYTFVNGVLKKYDLSSGVLTYLNSFPGLIGNVFQLNNLAYYTNGEVAKKWTLA